MPGPQQPSPDLDRDETHQDTGTDVHRSKTFRFFSWMTDNLINVAGGLVIASFVLASFLEIEIPRNLRIIAFSGVISLILVGKPTGSKVKSLLWDPSFIWLIDFDARYMGDGGIWKMPSQRFREWSVEDGELDWLTPNLAVGKNVDGENRTIEGVWRGTYTDRELAVALYNVQACRDTLEKRAQRGDILDATNFVIVKNAVSKYVRQIGDTFEKGTLPDDGKLLEQEINNALEDYGLDRSLEGLDEDHDPTDDLPGDEDPDLDDLNEDDQPEDPAQQVRENAVVGND